MKNIIKLKYLTIYDFSRKYVLLFVLSCVFFLNLSCTDNSTDIKNENPIDSNVKITFIELGSSTCIPCLNMRPIMDSIQNKYRNQILVKFIDVLKNSKEAEPYKIKLMPTQVFLDSLNNEIHRHEGFYPEDSIDIFLQAKGLKILNFK